MPSLWELMPPLIRNRVAFPPLEYATPIEIAKEIYDVMDGVLSEQIPVSNNISIGSVVIDASGLRTFSAGKNTIYLDVDGDAFFGSDLAKASTTSLVVLNNDQAYNGEVLSEGDIILGDNSSGAANMFWDRSTGKLQFRGGTTMQAEIDTDGSLLVGNIILDSSGIRTTNNETSLGTGGLSILLGSDSASNQLRQVNFKTTSDDITLEMYGVEGNGGDTPAMITRIRAKGGTGVADDDSLIGIEARLGDSDDFRSGFEVTTVTRAIHTASAGLGVGGSASNAALMAKDATVFNENSADVDFFIEGDTATTLFVVDAGLDAVQIGTTTAGVIADFRAASVVINEDGADQDLRVEGDTVTDVFNVDAGKDVAYMRGIGARVYNSSAITISDNTITALTFNTERFDTDTIHSTSSNTGRLTATTAGVYMITATVRWTSNSTGYRQLAIRKDGSTYIDSVLHDASGTQVVDQSVSTIYELAATNYVECIVSQTSGGNLDVISAGNYSPEFSMVKVA